MNEAIAVTLIIGISIAVTVTLIRVSMAYMDGVDDAHPYGRRTGDYREGNLRAVYMLGLERGKRREVILAARNAAEAQRKRDGQW